MGGHRTLKRAMLGALYQKIGQEGSNPLLHVGIGFRVILLGLLLFGFGLPMQVFGQENWNIFSRLERRVHNLEQKVLADSIRLSEYGKSTFYLYKYLNVSDSLGPQIHFSGYADAYFATYSDSVAGDYQKFPTSAPRSNQAGLNMLYFAGNYSSKRARANFGLHFGDIANSAWSEKYNMIQEANVGIALHNRLWVDAGFFRTHIGMESIQPRENICQSLAVTTYFEPYYLSGAKLSFQASDKLVLQLNAFNGFNTFVETNRNKALGASLVYYFNENTALTYNALYCDESPVTRALPQNRLYNDLYFVHRGKHLELGAEANYGFETNANLQDSTKNAFMYSFILACKLKLAKGRFGIYGRGEMFEDSNEILTGPVENQYHQLVGINLIGGTTGMEWRPIPNGCLRVEGRYLHTSDGEEIFYRHGNYYHYRLEGIVAMCVWF